MLLDFMASLRLADPSIKLQLAIPVAGPLTAAAEQLGARTHVLPMPAALAAIGDSSLRGRGRAAVALLRGIPAAWAGWRYVRRLRRLFELLRPDMVHSNGMKFHLLAALAARRDAPLVWHLHDFVGARPLMSRLLAQVQTKVVGAVAISHAVAENAGRGLSRLPIAVVHNAIDTDAFAPGPGDGAWLDELGGLPPAGDGVVRVGLVATFARWKGQDVFLDAARQLAHRPLDPAIRFYVVGGPVYQTRDSQWSPDELRARASDLLKRGAVGFVPFQENPAPVYRALDIVVHASTQPEPFGRTIVEAMACGRATVVARAGGAAELFTHDQDAVGVAPSDVGALAQAVGKLAREPERRDRLGAAARQSALQRFRRERLGPELLDAYHQFGLPNQSRRATREVQGTCHL
jgi:glycosyltransferase involved in cell wall biosynthesis